MEILILLHFMDLNTLCNGKGEFTLIETPNNRFKLQARMIETRSDGAW